ncbi:hybrid sensor histidine kinase/response regulator [Hydrogenophaga sp.]|uniref:hybrid sensor histidine kinase/response regulator n=1 Tax=Hydrogenophaga sp. TaxID=1904254 RepID=UPI00286DB669|nr:ATP-binding protein [Hydrogenophaga sp.]
MTDALPKPRRRLSLGPALIAALVLAALVPALLVSWLLSSNSSRAIETLAENAMSQAAHRVDVGALAHLGESHTVVNALVPPFVTSGAEGERTRRWLQDTPAFELMAHALTQQSPNVPYLYFGREDGGFFGLEREDNGFIVRSIQPGESGRRHYLIKAPGDRSQLVKTETKIYDPRQRPWYRLAASTGQRVFTDVYRSAVKNQFDLTLAQPIYDTDQKTLLGVMAVDMSLARLTELIRSTRISEHAVTYLVDAQGLMVATSVDEDLTYQLDGKPQRIKPEQSKDPLVQASYRLFKERDHGRPDGPGLMRLETKQDWLQGLGLTNNRLIAMQRPFGQKYQLNWQLIVVAPEQDFTHHVTRARQWALAAMAGLIGISALVAFVVARRLSGQFRLLNSSALRLGAGDVPPVQQHTRFREVHNLSQVMHASAVQLQAYHAEVEQKNDALREAALLLEERVAQRTAELAASREEALAAVKAKAGFLAVMSHEIRTPLHGVVGMSELLAESPLTPTQQDLLGVLKVSSDQLLAVVDDILDFSKIESGKLELEHEALDVRATIGQVGDMVRFKAREKGLTLVLDVAPEVPAAIRGDVTRLRQVLLNLLSNAIKFTERGQVALAVQARHEAGQPVLAFSVTDTGTGIAPHRLPQLFQPFAQGDTSTARVYGGTGLGLMICKHLVALMGGEIGVDSTPGVGSCFRFTVRAEPADLAQVPVPRRTPLPHAARTERVLVVDDHPVNIKVAGAMLQRLGYPHASASGGAEALQAIEAAHAAGQPFAVVLLDQHMPGLDGPDTAQAIVQRWGAMAPVLIGMSASNLGSDHARALGAGMREHLPKPLELERLARALRQWCPPPGDAVATAADHAAAADTAPALDPQRWQALAEYDDAHGSLRREIAGDFLDALAARTAHIEQAATASDTAALELAAHGLRGAADNLGLAALGALGLRLEAAAQQGRVDDAAFAGLRATSEAAVQALHTALAALPRA